MSEAKGTNLPLAADIATVVGDAAPEFNIDIEAEAGRLARKHSDTDASAATIAEVISVQIDLERQMDAEQKPGDVDEPPTTPEPSDPVNPDLPDVQDPPPDPVEPADEPRAEPADEPPPDIKGDEGTAMNPAWVANRP